MLSLGRLPQTTAIRLAATTQRRTLHIVKDFGYDVKKGIQPVWQEEIATMHYNHYLSLVDKLNNAIMNTEDEDLSAQKILLKYPEHKPLYDLAAEVVNHEVMWFALKPGGVAPSEKMLMMLNIQFGGIERFESLWKSKAVALHGSGWMWLVSDYSQLEISMGFNAGTPKPPVIGLLSMDVWEHAYFTQYGSNRKAYVENFLKAVNWEFIERVITRLYPGRDFALMQRASDGVSEVYMDDDIDGLVEIIPTENLITLFEDTYKSNPQNEEPKIESKAVPDDVENKEKVTSKPPPAWANSSE